MTSRPFDELPDFGSVRWADMMDEDEAPPEVASYGTVATPAQKPTASGDGAWIRAKEARHHYAVPKHAHKSHTPKKQTVTQEDGWTTVSKKHRRR